MRRKRRRQPNNCIGPVSFVHREVHLSWICKTSETSPALHQKNYKLTPGSLAIFDLKAPRWRQKCLFKLGRLHKDGERRILKIRLQVWFIWKFQYHRVDGHCRYSENPLTSQIYFLENTLGWTGGRSVAWSKAKFVAFTVLQALRKASKWAGGFAMSLRQLKFLSSNTDLNAFPLKILFSFWCLYSRALRRN